MPPPPPSVENGPSRPPSSHPPQGGGGTHDLSLLFFLFFAPPCDSRRRPVRYGIWKHSVAFKGCVASRLAVERLCVGDFSNLFDSMVGLGGSVLLHASIAERGGMRDTHTHTYVCHSFSSFPFALHVCGFFFFFMRDAISPSIHLFPIHPAAKSGESLLHCSLSLD